MAAFCQIASRLRRHGAATDHYHTMSQLLLIAIDVDTVPIGVLCALDIRLLGRGCGNHYVKAHGFDHLRCCLRVQMDGNALFLNLRPQEVKIPPELPLEFRVFSGLDLAAQCIGLLKDHWRMAPVLEPHGALDGTGAAADQRNLLLPCHRLHQTLRPVLHADLRVDGAVAHPVSRGGGAPAGMALDAGVQIFAVAVPQDLYQMLVADKQMARRYKIRCPGGNDAIEGIQILIIGGNGNGRLHAPGLESLGQLRRLADRHPLVVGMLTANLKQIDIGIDGP